MPRRRASRTASPSSTSTSSEQTEHGVVATPERGPVASGTAARSPAVASEPSGDGRYPGNAGFEAASTKKVNGPGPIFGQRQPGAPWMDSLHRQPVDPHQALGLEAGRVGMEAEIDHGFQLRAGQLRVARRRRTGTRSCPTAGSSGRRQRTAGTHPPWPRRTSLVRPAHPTPPPSMESSGRTQPGRHPLVQLASESELRRSSSRCARCEASERGNYPGRMTQRPLDGVRVLDFTRVLSGPALHADAVPISAPT